VKAVIYTRISRDPQHDELGVLRQLKECRELCAAKGWTIVDELKDDDRSAYSGKRRKGYEAALAMLSDHRATMLVAWHVDRITRQPKELEALIDLIESTRAKVATVTAGEYDLSTSAGRMAARIVGAVARGESEHKSERAKSKHRELAERGLGRGGGRRPYGYSADGEKLVDSEARVLRRCAERILDGETLHAVIADLNRREVPTTTGAPWSTTVLRRMLLAPRLAGLRAHNGERPVKASWSPILSERDHERLVLVLTDPRRRTTSETPQRYLLTGLVACGRCGTRLVGQPQRGHRTYVCVKSAGGCGRMRITAEPVEDLVAGAVALALDAPTLADTVAAMTDDSGPFEALAAIDARLGELGEAFAAGEINRTVLAAGVRRLAAERDALADKVRSGVRGRVLGLVGADLGAAWPTLSPDRQRAVLDAVLDKVTIAPATPGIHRFEPERVGLAWKALDA
jgi:DNA invertase Pin-like site-specific DNA recombinase